VSRATYALSLLSALAVAVAAAGCGGGGETSSGEATGERSAPSTTTTTETSDQPEKGAWGVVFGAEGEELGIILYDLSGHTLYTFSKDQGGTSSCYGACAKTWPPALTEGKPRAGGEAVAGKVGTTKRKDGTVQLTYAGHPLYTHAGEKQTETNGNGAHAFGGEWSAIRPSGEKP
jgi:predicted lipoprotein with Yx(FWY)xxD motif